MKRMLERLGFDKRTMMRFLLVILNSQLIYAFTAIRSVLYDPFLEALGVTNTQFGVLMGFIGFITVFGGLAVGWLQDRFSVRKILAVNTFMYGGWALVMSLWPGCPYALKCLFFISFGFNGDAMYWATVLKSVRTMAGENKQATAFGLMESLRCGIDVIIGAAAVAVYTFLGSNLFGIRAAMTFNSCLTLLSGVLIWMFIPEEKPVERETKETAKTSNKTKKAFEGFLAVLRMPAVWMTGISAMCVYAIFCAVYTYFVPYMQNVYLLSAGLVGVFGVANGSGIRVVMGVFSGMISDNKFKSSAHMMRFAYSVLAVLLTAVLLIPKSSKYVIPVMIILLLISAFSGMVRSVYYAPIGELGVSEDISAAAMAVAACIGYSPSFWAYPLYGSMIDKLGSQTAYQLIFILLLVMSVAGIVVDTILGKKIVVHKQKKNHTVPEKIS